MRPDLVEDARRHRRASREPNVGGLQGDGVVRRRNVSNHTRGHRKTGHVDRLADLEFVGLPGHGLNLHAGNVRRRLDVRERDPHRSRDVVNRDLPYLAVERVRRRDVHALEIHGGQRAAEAVEHVGGGDLDAVVLAAHGLGQEREAVDVDLRLVREMGVGLHGRGDAPRRDVRGDPVEADDQTGEHNQHDQPADRVPHQPTMIRATTSTPGATTRSGSVEATGQVDRPSAATNAAARAASATATATAATAAAAPTPTTVLCCPASTPNPIPAAAPTGSETHSGNLRCTGSTATPAATRATATTSTPPRPPRTPSNDAPAMASAPAATVAASESVSRARPSRRASWTTKATPTTAASTPASPRTSA